MKPERVQSVHQILFGLQPITVHWTAHPRSHSGFEHATPFLPDIVNGKLRLLVEWAHIGKEQAAKLAHGIAGMLDLFEERIVCRLQWHFEDVTLHIVEPTVIAASESPFFDPAVFQRCAAMAAAKKQHTRPALSVTETNQIFAENSHALGHILEIRRQTNRLPITPHQLAARRPRADACQLGIGFRYFETVSAFHRFADYN